MPLPTLSVLMPNYNHGRFISDALDSILNQSVAPTEVIVIDDCSTDNSAEIIAGFEKERPNLRFIRNERNMGVIYNMNRLLELSSCDYLHYAAADDKIMPGFYEQSLKMLVRHPRAGICSTKSFAIDENGKIIGQLKMPLVSRKPCFIPPEKAIRLLQNGAVWIHGNAAVYRREFLVEAGGFVAELDYFCDGFLHQLLSVRHGACFIPKPLACFRQMESNYSQLQNDPGPKLKIQRHLNDVISATHRELMPPGFTPVLSGYHGETLARAAADEWWFVRRKQREAVFNALIPMLGHGRPGRMALEMSFRALSFAQTALLRLYLAVRGKMF